LPTLRQASNAFTAVFDELEIKQSTSTPALSVWGNFAITQTDDEHPIARRVHVAFIAPTPAHVDRFGQAGVEAGFADDGPAGPRPNYADDYYAAFLVRFSSSRARSRIRRRRARLRGSNPLSEAALGVWLVRAVPRAPPSSVRRR
jgi:hypothetical protein